MSKLESIEHYTGVIRGRLVDIERNAGDQHEKVKKLQAERDELKRQVKVWERLAVKVEQEDWEHAEQQATTVPRVITAEEMKAGQKLAIESVGGVGDVFTVQSVGTSWEGYPAAYKTGGIFWAMTEDERIWLLEDASAEGLEPVKMGDTISTDQLEQAAEAAYASTGSPIAWDVVSKPQRQTYRKQARAALEAAGLVIEE